MITYRKGNIFHFGPKVLIHGVNCQGVMGAGIALQIKNKYPWAYDDYKHFCSMREPEWLLGKIRKSWCWHGDPLTIVHAFTQFSTGEVRSVSYDAVDDVMVKIAQEFTTDQELSMPKIGAGLGGGNWNVIEAIINDRLANYNVLVYEL